MAITKQRQWEIKFNKLDSKVGNKANLKFIVEYDSELALRNHSFAGRLQYLTILEQLADFKGKGFKEFVEPDLKEFFSQLKPRGFYANKMDRVSPQTRWIYMCLVKQFFKWLYNMDDESVPPVVKWIKRKQYHPPKQKLRPEELLTPREVKELVKGAPFTRDAAFIFSLFESGCRVTSEFLPLKIKDLQISKRYACFDVKGDLKTLHSERTCFLIRSWPYVRNWLNVHPSRDNPNAPLWPVMTSKGLGNPITHDGARHIIRRAIKNTSLTKHVWPHLLRHSRALECAVKGYNNQVMCKMFGWSENSDMPGWYINLSNSNVKQVVLEKEGLASEVEDNSMHDLDTVTCPNCSQEHSAVTKFCTCGFVLDELEVQKLDVNRMQKAMYLLQAAMKDIEGLKAKGLSQEQFEEFINNYTAVTKPSVVESKK